MALVKFEFNSENAQGYDLVIQQASDSGQEWHMIRNPEEFEFEDGMTYVYLLRVVGNPGTKYKLDITDATNARTPIEREIGSGQVRDSFLDSFVA